MGERNVAVVLSGGGINGVLLELGFLKRLRESPLWPRIGWYYGTSAGALSSCMAAIGRLDDLEEFLLGLQPDETFRPHRLWRLPLLGTHDYVLPRTIAERLGEPYELAVALRDAEAEVVVVVTDVTLDDGDPSLLFERAYSSRTAPPEEMAQAVLASAAISTLVLPLRVGARVATDGAWVRNYPLGYAYERPETELIVAFRYEPRPPRVGPGAVAALVGRLRRYSRLPAARTLVAELEEAAEREARGEVAHLVDTFARLSRVAILRNTALEELVAGWREQTLEELRSLREDVAGLVGDGGPGTLAEAVDARFEATRLPFGGSRHVPRITVAGSVGERGLEYGFRRVPAWPVELKRTLIERGYGLADEQLAAADLA